MELVKNQSNLPSFLPDKGQWTKRFEVKSQSSNRLYIIAFNKNTQSWGCSCPGWIIHRKCKHLGTLGNMLKQIEGSEIVKDPVEVKKLDESFEDSIFSKIKGK